jgi:gas vesicle protein
MAERESHGFRYFVFGAVAGVIGGLLLAPKPGTELREDLADYGERGRGLARRILDKIPFRIKAAGATGAVKGAASETYEQVRESV